MTDLFASGDNSSNSFDDSNDEIARKNETAFKYTTIFHTNLSEKLYHELCALAFGEFDIPQGQISPLMWTRLHEIYSEVEMQTRKLPAGSNYSASSQKYANEAVQIASVLSIYTALAHEYDETVEVSLLSKLVVEDVEFRRIYALLLWSEKAISEQQYEKGLGDKVRKLEGIKSSRINSMMALKRPTFGAANAPKDASLDPDAPGTKEDQALEQMAMNVFFQLIRSGETSKAANLAIDLGMGAIGAQLQLHSMLRNPLDIPLEASKQNFGEYKRSRRAKYYQMTQKLIEQSQGSEDDAYWMLISAIRGNIQPMLKAGKSVIEKVWAYANSAVLARILAAEGAMTQETISTLFNVPLTSKSILDELRSEADRTKEVYILLRVIDDMLNDDIEDLYKFANETVGEFVPNDKNCQVNMLALDIFFHLVAVSYASGFEPNDDGNAVIILGFDDLRARSGTSSHKKMAAFYSRFLPEDMKLPEIVETMKAVDSDEEREILAESLKQSDIDFGRCACTLIEQIRKDDKTKVVTLEEQIDHWHWLLIGGEETALAALEECNRLVRKVMLSTPIDESVIRQIIRKALHFEVPKLLSQAVENEATVLSLITDGTLFEQKPGSQLAINKIEHAALEFYGLCSFVDVNNFMITIALKLGLMFKYTPITDDELSMIGGVKRLDNTTAADWEASLRVRARAEQTLREEVLKKRAAEHNTRVGMVQQHLDTVLPMLRGLVNNIGVRPEYFLSPRANGDPMRVHRKEIQEIRNLFLPQFFILLAQAAVRLDDTTNFNDFFTSFNNDLGLDQEWMVFIKAFYAELNLKVE
ncbi:Nuclear pore complex protein 5 [Caenorhabditis elegans]|uniref:Nuclear pore complex protein 5 n=1 Tax=Caenorhabditis elegans TaxID=6239 RepID=NPP5_CAEEL|nr:Nuclear pore complex protein 5 [Caenorhabditis elegans]Q19131.1 RecName: Full=Nuclear pore complex protein 5; AltName: Full=Nuclear pore complex protein Nup107; AltName: Full=Nucleoporin npp-5 [Caenorhabditis elegans]CAA91316.1 Nuclear pore complex protein 5 [Caenorhabditis elegans]|eukprot:NP_496481.1 Nuclear pore complex protein 5 [Caenorhabditis elegans]